MGYDGDSAVYWREFSGLAPDRKANAQCAHAVAERVLQTTRHSLDSIVVFMKMPQFNGKFRHQSSYYRHSTFNHQITGNHQFRN